MIVDFMIIGAQKCGTTSLANHLAEHPQVCFCDEKEPNFFNTYSPWQEHVKNYHKMFRCKTGQKLGEASTMYSSLPEFQDTHTKIYSYNPEMRLIYIMRDPVERIISHYAHRLVRKRVEKTIEEEINSNAFYIDRSLYSMQIKPYIETFGREQVYLLTYESMISQPREKLMEIAKFIDINLDFYNNVDKLLNANRSSDRYVLPDFGNITYFDFFKKLGRKYLPIKTIKVLLNLFGNKLDKKPDFPPAFRKDVYNQVKSDIEELENLLGRELTEWKKY